MSLSDGERLSGLYHSLYRLTNLRIRLHNEMKRRNIDEDVLREIRSLLNGLWHDSWVANRIARTGFSAATPQENFLTIRRLLLRGQLLCVLRLQRLLLSMTGSLGKN